MHNFFFFLKKQTRNWFIFYVIHCNILTGITWNLGPVWLCSKFSFCSLQSWTTFVLRLPDNNNGCFQTYFLDYVFCGVLYFRMLLAPFVTGWLWTWRYFHCEQTEAKCLHFIHPSTHSSPPSIIGTAYPLRVMEKLSLVHLIIKKKNVRKPLAGT